MTGAQFSALLERVGWKGRWLAERLGLSRGHMGDMMTGRVTVHPAITDYVQRVAKAIDSVPLPDMADRRFRED